MPTTAQCQCLLSAGAPCHLTPSACRWCLLVPILQWCPVVRGALYPLVSSCCKFHVATNAHSPWCWCLSVPAGALQCLVPVGSQCCLVHTISHQYPLSIWYPAMPGAHWPWSLLLVSSFRCLLPSGFYWCLVPSGGHWCLMALASTWCQCLCPVPSLSWWPQIFFAFYSAIDQ